MTVVNFPTQQTTRGKNWISLGDLVREQVAAQINAQNLDKKSAERGEQ